MFRIFPCIAGGRFLVARRWAFQPRDIGWRRACGFALVVLARNHVFDVSCGLAPRILLSYRCAIIAPHVWSPRLRKRVVGRLATFRDACNSSDFGRECATCQRRVSFALHVFILAALASARSARPLRVVPVTSQPATFLVGGPSRGSRSSAACSLSPSRFGSAVFASAGSASFKVEGRVLTAVPVQVRRCLVVHCCSALC